MENVDRTGEQGDRLLVPAGVMGTMLVALVVAGAILAICLVAPTEQTMGHAQRIVYVHVAVAWFGLAGLLLAAAAGLGYLVRRELAWDQWAQAGAELGWLCSSLTLITGSLWAHEAWGTWWTWDPRLTTAFILWAIYSAYLLVRGSLEERFPGDQRQADAQTHQHRGVPLLGGTGCSGAARPARRGSRPPGSAARSDSSAGSTPAPPPRVRSCRSRG